MPYRLIVFSKGIHFHPIVIITFLKVVISAVFLFFKKNHSISSLICSEATIIYSISVCFKTICVWAPYELSPREFRGVFLLLHGYSFAMEAYHLIISFFCFWFFPFEPFQGWMPQYCQTVKRIDRCLTWFSFL
jgi:hypothetical protein